MDQEKDDKIMNQNSDRKTKKKGWIQNVWHSTSDAGRRYEHLLFYTPRPLGAT